MKFAKQSVLLLAFVMIFAACGSATPTPSTTAAPTNTTQSNPTASPTDAPTNATTTAQPTAVPPSATTAPTQPQPTNAPSTTAPTQAPPTKAQPTQPPATSDSGTGAGGQNFSLDIEPIATDLRRPVLVTNAGDGSGRLFLVEQPGTILIYQNGAVLEKAFLHLGNKLTTGGNEQGLLGLAFDPNYKTNGFLYVNYSEKGSGDNITERYHVSADPNVADPDSGQVILTIPGLEPNHNGGMLAFGPDGYLYIGTGDGGGAGDRHGTIGNGQNLESLNGKILRIDVNADTYKVPADNPFANDANAKPEIWAYGLRNPWRFSFDRGTGDLYIADVGQGNREEIDFQPAGSKGGENYGWRILEANECYDEGQNCDTPNLVAPIADYSHDLGCAVTGGYVYRGSEYPWLVGQYLYADYCTGVIWAAARDAGGTWQVKQITKFDDTISSFGEGEDGALYIAGHKNGTIYKITSAQ